MNARAPGRQPRALVTGATGFVGSHMAPGLLSAGWCVAVLVRPSSDWSRLPDGVTVVEDDGTAAGLDAVMATADPDVVFHLATHFLSPHTPDDVPALIEGNVLLGTRVAEALATRGDRLFVNTASAWQHYDGADYRPVALYAATKQAQEDILRYYTEMERLRVVTLILFDTYGPGDRRRKLVPLVAESAMSGNVLRMSGGEQLIDLLHVDDVVAAFLRAAELGDSAERYQSYVVSSGSPVSVRDAVAALEEATGRTVPVEWGARPYRDREMFEPWHAGAPLPGWKPEVGLVDGLRRTFAP